MDNKKIKSIRRLPGGNDIVLIWFFLLVTAGDSNQNGGLFIADTIPYHEEDFAAEYGFEVQQIRFALLTLEKYGMIEIFDDVVWIKNWEEYQNIEGLGKIREQTRKRVAEYRERKRLESCNVTCNADVTQGNATEQELEEELDKELDKDKELEPKKIGRVDYQGVIDEYNLTCSKMPKAVSLTKPRKGSINSRIREQGREAITTVFRYASQEKFYNGDNDRGWRADFDWLMGPKNFVRMLERAKSGFTQQKKSAAQRFMECDDIDQGRNETDIDIDCERMP